MGTTPVLPPVTLDSVLIKRCLFVKYICLPLAIFGLYTFVLLMLLAIVDPYIIPIIGDIGSDIIIWIALVLGIIGVALNFIKAKEE